MYFPYFRGKRFELLAIRDTAGVIAQHNFVPIIEPVKEQLDDLERALEAICEVGAQSILIFNPQNGELVGRASSVVNLWNESFSETENVVPGLILTENMSIEEIVVFCNAHRDHNVALIHQGFSSGRELAEALARVNNIQAHVFIAEYSGRLYRDHFERHPQRVLIDDGFVRRVNRDHPDDEFFSDLIQTHARDGLQGFGDFLTVGDEYSQSGGPAFTVAIHLSYINENRDGSIFIRHFLSDSRLTADDTPGKFREAMVHLIEFLDSDRSMIEETSAVRELRDLNDRNHYPGLGALKRLSLTHHIETISLSDRQLVEG
ncbi:sce7725 family protein [Pseudovibrio sp. SCP19]|uniref:sce7725 family protein n=1 Tax=Pseudovibrio sp. SCP19 TaxID=3141374 RepID=UPI003335128D